MPEKIANILSYTFHPLLFPIYTLVVLLTQKPYNYLDLPISYIFLLSGIVFLTTLLFPLLITYLLYRKKIISSLFLLIKEERIYPILCAAVFYYVTYYLLKGALISGFFGFYMLGATLLAIFALLINFYQKISLHMISTGAVTGLFIGITIGFGINFIPFILAGIILSGLLGFARLKTKAHTPAEVYSGFLMGLITMSVMIILI